MLRTKYKEIQKVSFNDGKCDIYSVEGRKPVNKIGTFNFSNDTIGIKSYYGFQTIGVEIQKVISIPYNELINQSRLVVIGDEAYQISLIQVKDTFPKTLKITLSKSSIKWGVAND